MLPRYKYRREGKKQGASSAFFLSALFNGVKGWGAILLLISAVHPFTLKGQNLVSSRGFEEKDSCPTDLTQLNFCKNWFNPTSATPDYFHECASGKVGIPNNVAGHQNPKRENAYAGIVPFVDTNHSSPNRREYIETILKKELETGKYYCASVFISLADSSRFASGKLGFHFSKDSLTSSLPYVLSATPQIELFSDPVMNDTDWVQGSGSFQSTGNEKYITIGNFNDHNNTPFQDSATPYPWYSGNNDYLGYAYYYIDDVSVIPVEPVRLAGGGDTSIVRGDSVRLSRVEDTITAYSWSPSTSLDDPNAAGPWASPEETTTYTVTKRTYCDTTTAQVTVHVEDPPPPPEERLFIPNVFAPGSEGHEANKSFRVLGGPFEEYHLQVFSRWGEMVFESEDPGEGWDGRHHGEPMEAGVYVYRFRAVLEDGTEVERSGDVTLVR